MSTGKIDHPADVEREERVPCLDLLLRTDEREVRLLELQVEDVLRAGRAGAQPSSQHGHHPQPAQEERQAPLL